MRDVLGVMGMMLFSLLLVTTCDYQRPADVPPDARISSPCGDGIVFGSEICDDGNIVDGDGCDRNCKPTGCQNGIPTAGEQCDDGNATNGDGCDINCKFTGCGNGVRTAGETCDDGNTTSGDGCDSNCKLTSCGNGIATAGEQCDDGNTITESCVYGQTSCTVCNSTCQAVSGATSFCNDGIRQTAFETCDDGNPSCGTCSGNCQMVLTGHDCLALETCQSDFDCASLFCDGDVCL